MKSNKKLPVFAVLFVGISVLLVSCWAATPTPMTVGGTTPLTLTVQLNPDSTNYGTCDFHVSTMQVIVTGSASELARVASIDGELNWSTSEGVHPDALITGVSLVMTRQPDGTYLDTYDWSSGIGLNQPLILYFDAAALDSTGAVIKKSDVASVSFMPCPGISSLSPLVHFPVTLVAPSPHLTANADLSPDPVYYEPGCNPHVSNVRVTLSGTFASLVSSLDAGLGWTLPDGTPAAGANGVPLTLTLQPDGSYTASFDWGVHPPGLTGPYVLTFTATAIDSSGTALNKQVAVAQFLPCPAPLTPTPGFPYHLVKFAFDCINPNSTVMIFTFDQAVAGTYEAKIGSQTWQCQLNSKNNQMLICTGPGVDQNIPAQVSLFDVQKPQVVLTQDTKTPVCEAPTAAPRNAPAPTCTCNQW